MGLTPKVMFIIDHSVEGADSVHDLAPHAVRRDRPQGQRHQRRLGASPDLPLAPSRHGADRGCWPALDRRTRSRALAHASTHLVPEHFDEVRARREKTVERRWPGPRRLVRKSASGPTAIHQAAGTTSPPAKDVRLTHWRTSAAPSTSPPAATLPPRSCWPAPTSSPPRR